MLNYTNTRIVYALLLAVLIFTCWKYGISEWHISAMGLLLASYLALLIYGSYFIQSGFFVKSLCKGDSGKKQIAITFDDGPIKDFTPKLLDILKAENVPAAFFLIGKNIRGNEALVKRMIAEGHVIGNHSFEHGFWFSLQSKNKMISDAQKCDAAIEELTGLHPKLFRPPYGVTNPMVAQLIQQQNYHSIGWSVRTYDTNVKSAEHLLQKTLKNLSAGDIILFHDWGQYTIGILSEFICQARKRGFEFVRVDDLLNIKAYC